MDRRGFLGAILAAASAPAIVRAQSLMPTRSGILVPEKTKLWVPEPYVAEGKVRVQTLGGTRGLRMGDALTIAGVTGTFRITSITEGGTMLLSSLVPPSVTDDARFSDGP